MKALLSLILVAAAFTLSSCDSKKSTSQTVHREGQPDYVRVPETDPEMDRAIQSAHDSVDTFILALRNRAPTQVGFSVKKPFKDGTQVEHIWLSDASFDGTVFRGRVDNEPVDVTNVKLGDKATVSKGEVSDWFYIDGGKLVGGYTLRVLYSRMSEAEKKEFLSHVPFQME